MSSNLYTSKYPRIIVDKRANSVNDSLKKVLTIEEFYDIMHHTHPVSVLTVNEGEMTYNEMQNTVNNLTEKLNTYDTTINQQQEIIKKLEADTTELRNLIKTQNNIIQTMKTEMENMASVSDWDVEKPGIQDANGNDLGTFMGYKVTEITE